MPPKAIRKLAQSVIKALKDAQEKRKEAGSACTSNKCLLALCKLLDEAPVDQNGKQAALDIVFLSVLVPDANALFRR
jgi:hypothetical protein